MGCGASKVTSTNVLRVDQQRDDEDLQLEHTELHESKIPQFDSVFGNLEELLNTLGSLNNNINDSIADIKSSLAPLYGAFQLQLQPSFSTDIIQLELWTRDGRRAPPHVEVAQLLSSSAEVAAADAELEQARAALASVLAQSEHHIPLRVIETGVATDALSGPTPQLNLFNDSLAKLRSLLEHSGYKVIVAVKAEGVHKATTVNARIMKQIALSSSTEPVLKPATLLELSCTPRHQQVKEALNMFTSKAQQFAQRAKSVPNLELKIVSNCRVAVVGQIVDLVLRHDVNRALFGVNVALFRLVNSCACATQNISLSTAVCEVVRPLLAMVKEAHARQQLTCSPTALVSVSPTVQFVRHDGMQLATAAFSFDLNLLVDEAINVGVFPDCLPLPAQHVWAAIQRLQAHVSEALRQLPQISEDVDVLLEQAKEFYELAPEAAAKQGLTMMEAVKSAKATGHNLKILMDTQKLFMTFGDNIKRVADGLASSGDAVAQLVQEVLGNSDTIKVDDTQKTPKDEATSKKQNIVVVARTLPS